MARKNSMGFFKAVAEAAKEHGVNDYFVMTDTCTKIDNHGNPVIREVKKAVDKILDGK